VDGPPVALIVAHGSTSRAIFQSCGRWRDRVQDSGLGDVAALDCVIYQGRQERRGIVGLGGLVDERQHSIVAVFRYQLEGRFGELGLWPFLSGGPIDIGPQRVVNLGRCLVAALAGSPA
jgi:hypothetical protein